MPDITIIICTLHRLQQLEAALLSCLALRHLDTYDVEILVVDNSPDADGWDVVSRLADSGMAPIRHVHEPRVGIAHARNSGIAAARAPLIAFVDDDMRLSPGWLHCVMCRMTEGRADALICAITPRVEDLRQVADPRVLAAYCRDLGLPEGSRVRRKPSGHIPGAGAGNSVLRRATCIIEPEPFDPAFGNGGEDTDFFMRLGRRVPKILWSADSMAYEMVSPTRATMDFVTYGAVRGSRNLARALIKNSRHRLITRAALLTIGCGQGICRMAYYYLLRVARPADAPYARLSAVAAFGKVPWRLERGSWWALPR